MMLFEHISLSKRSYLRWLSVDDHDHLIYWPTNHPNNTDKQRRYYEIVKEYLQDKGISARVDFERRDHFSGLEAAMNPGEYGYLSINFDSEADEALFITYGIPLNLFTDV